MQEIVWNKVASDVLNFFKIPEIEGISGTIDRLEPTPRTAELNTEPVKPLAMSK